MAKLFHFVVVVEGDHISIENSAEDICNGDVWDTEKEEWYSGGDPDQNDECVIAAEKLEALLEKGKK